MFPRNTFSNKQKKVGKTLPRFGMKGQIPIYFRIQLNILNSFLFFQEQIFATVKLMETTEIRIIVTGSSPAQTKLRTK